MKKETGLNNVMLMCLNSAKLQSRKKKEKEPPPGVEEVVSKRNGKVRSVERRGNRYKVKVVYPVGGTKFEIFHIAPEGKCLEHKLKRDYSEFLAKRRKARIRIRSIKKDD